jgi:hypothetical protein
MCGKLDRIGAGRMLREAVAEERTTISIIKIVGFLLLFAAGETLDVDDNVSFTMLARTASLTFALFASLSLS